MKRLLKLPAKINLWSRRGWLLSLLCVACWHLPLQAKQPQESRADNRASQLQVRSGQQAAQIVKSQLGGKILKVDSSNVDGSPGYRVKVLLDDGRIVYMSVNAATGRVSNR